MDPVTFRDGYVIRDQNAHHFLTFTVCGWIDLFTRKIYRDILLNSLQYCQHNKGLIIHAYVIMSNHVHLIVRAREGYTLSDIVRDFKKYTSRHMLEIVDSEAESRRHWMLHQFAYYGSRHAKKQDHQIWTNDSHPEALYTAGMTFTKLNYLHQNPVRAGWVADATHYLYSSAGDYAGHKGLLEIELLF